MRHDILAGRRVLAFVGDIYEDLELWYPKLRLQEAGAQVVLAGQEALKEYAGKNGYPCKSDVTIASVDSQSFDGLLLPGGFMPDKLRRDPEVLRIIREFDSRQRLIAAHLPWRLVSHLGESLSWSPSHWIFRNQG